MIRNLNEMTTIQVVQADKELFRQKVPANNDYERFYKILDFYIRNYDVPNIVAYSRELNEKYFDPINQVINDKVKELIGIEVKKILDEQNGR